MAVAVAAMNSVALLDQLVLLGEPMVWLCFLLSLWRTLPPRRIQRLYPFRARIRWILPFSNRWQKEIAPEHVARIRRFRGRIFFYFVAILTVPLLKAAYYEFLFGKLHAIQ